MERREFIRRSMLTVVGAGVAASTLADGAAASRQSHCLWGAGVQPRGGESHETAIKRLENMVDRKLKILRCYEDWEDMAPTNYVRWAVNRWADPVCPVARPPRGWWLRLVGCDRIRRVRRSHQSEGRCDPPIRPSSLLRLPSRARARSAIWFARGVPCGMAAGPKHLRPGRHPERHLGMRARGIHPSWVARRSRGLAPGRPLHGRRGRLQPRTLRLDPRLAFVQGDLRRRAQRGTATRPQRLHRGIRVRRRHRLWRWRWRLESRMVAPGCRDDQIVAEGQGCGLHPRRGIVPGTTPDYWIDTSRSSLQAYRKVGLRPYFL